MIIIIITILLRYAVTNYSNCAPIPVRNFIRKGTLLKVYREFAYYLASLKSWSFSWRWVKGQRTKLKRKGKSDFKVSFQLAESSANTMSAIGVKEKTVNWRRDRNSINFLEARRFCHIYLRLHRNLILFFVRFTAPAITQLVSLESNEAGLSFIKF
jgi:hypothetical protein